MDFYGIPLTIEVPRGGTRSGTSPDGSKWSRTLTHHYGEIPGTIAPDGEPLDVWLGPSSAKTVFIINQVKKDGSLDEQKIMLGFRDVDAAVDGYLENMPSECFGGVFTSSLEELKKRINRDLETREKVASRDLRLQALANTGVDVNLLRLQEKLSAAQNPHLYKEALMGVIGTAAKNFLGKASISGAKSVAKSAPKAIATAGSTAATKGKTIGAGIKTWGKNVAKNTKLDKKTILGTGALAGAAYTGKKGIDGVSSALKTEHILPPGRATPSRRGPF